LLLLSVSSGLQRQRRNCNTCECCRRFPAIQLILNEVV
jgi:hypothetical protein